MRLPSPALLAILMLCAAACGPDPDRARRGAAETEIPVAAETAELLGELPEAGKVVADTWYAWSRNGRVFGRSHVVFRESTHLGEPSLRDTTEIWHSTSRGMSGMVDTYDSRQRMDRELRPEDGGLMLLRAVTQEADRTTLTTQTWNGGGYDQVEIQGKLVERRAVECEEPVPFDGEAFLRSRILEGSLTPGMKLHYDIPDFRVPRMDTMEITVVGTASLAQPSGPVQCWYVREVKLGAPGVTEMWIDLEGVLRRFEREGLLLVSTTRARAMGMESYGANFSITFPAEPFLPRCTSLDRATVAIDFTQEEGLDLPEFPDTPFSREIGREDSTIRLELTAYDDPAADTAFPVSDPALARELESTNLLCANAPEVREAALEAVGDTKSAREAARRILAFVFLNLNAGSGPVVSPNAAEILRDGLGDCSEHNVLFVAMCRSVGIPARRVMGYAQVADMWGSHAFAEVWLGRWIGADPTTNELGTRARYIAFGRPEDPDSHPMVVAARAQGRMSIRTLTFEEGGKVWDAEEAERTELDDPFSGLHLAPPPPGWTAQTSHRTGMATLEGPDVHCSVSVSAGMGDLSADILAERILPGASQVRFAGIRSCRTDRFRGSREYVELWIPSRRRLLHVSIRSNGGDTAAAIRTLEAILAPTL